MAAIALAIAGLATAGVGFLKGQNAAKDAKAANASITAASVQAENLRQKQTQLDNLRRQRETIRQSLIARSVALSGATASGAQYSSGLAGGEAQIAGQAGQNLLAQGQNLDISNGLFSANRDKMQSEFMLSNAKTDQSTAQGLFSLGSSMVNNAAQFGKNANSLFNGKVND